MKKQDIYVVTSTVAAVAMSLGEYNTLRGWTIPEDEDAKAEGYLIENQGESESNHPDYKGRISWVPKVLFDATYRQIGVVQETNQLLVNLIREFNEVNDKVEPLRVLLNKPKPDFISEREWLTLFDQLDAQSDYRDCLLTRISIHTIPEKQPTPNDPDYIPAGLGALGEDE